MTPSGIIMQSGSIGATQEALHKVFTDNKLEPETPETEIELPVAPKPEDFENDEDYEKAQEDFDSKEAEREEKEEEEAAKREEEEEAKKPKLTRRQKAIEKATRDLKEQNRKLEERLAAVENGKKPAAAQPKLEAPKRESFKTDEEFNDALFDYRYKLRRSKEQNEEALRLANEKVKEVTEFYQSNVRKFREGLDVDDWDETLNQTLPVHDAVIFSIGELENGPQVSYYLGKHPDFTKKLAEISPYSAVMEVGRLAARLKTGAANRAEADGRDKKKTTRAKIPTPVKPVNSSPKTSTMSSAEAAKERNFRAFKVAQRAGR